MAKKNREDDGDGRFRVSKTKMGRPELVTVTFQLTDYQETHLYNVAKDEGTSRAEFAKQCVSYCLKQMEKPFPELSEITDELREAMHARQVQRQEWAESRGKGGEASDE